MVPNKLQSKCDNGHSKQTHVATQCEQLPATKCYTRGIQYEPQTFISTGTQCKLSIASTGVQCSKGNSIPVLYKSCGTQHDLVQFVSKSTQCFPEDVLISRPSQLHDVHKLSSEPYFKHISSKSSSKQRLFQKENSLSSCMLQSCAEAMQTSGANITSNCKMKQHHRPDEFSTISKCNKKQRKETNFSSSTSGVTDMDSSRSGIQDSSEGHPGTESAKAVKKKKKLLWTYSSSMITISDAGGDSLDCSGLFRQNFPQQKRNKNTEFSILPRSKYTYEEEMAIIEFIAERNLYGQVGGVRMWQDMETELGIARTWQSLKERFRKKILPNIDKFNLPSNLEESFKRNKMR